MGESAGHRAQAARVPSEVVAPVVSAEAVPEGAEVQDSCDECCDECELHCKL